MSETLFRTTSDQVRLHPVPGRTPHPEYPELATLSREEFLRQYLPGLQQYDRSLSRTLTPLGKAAYEEWVARSNHAKAQIEAKNQAIADEERQLREDIVEALMAEGKARHVAFNLIDTEAKMLAQGKRLGVL